MTMNLMILLCLVAVINNVVTISSARELNKNIPPDHDEKIVNIVEDPSKNKRVDKNQIPPFGLPIPYAIPLPSPRIIPGFPLPFPLPIPIPGPLDIFPAYYIPAGADGVPSPPRA